MFRKCVRLFIQARASGYDEGVLEFNYSQSSFLSQPLALVGVCVFFFDFPSLGSCKRGTSEQGMVDVGLVRRCCRAYYVIRFR